MTPRLGLDWEVWAIAQLAAGSAAQDVVDALGVEGVDANEARAQLDQIVATPSFAMLRQRVVRGTMADQLLRARLEIAPITAIERRPTIDADEFYERHWRTSRPIVLTEAARQIRAVQTWTFANLAERFGELAIEVNVRRGEATRGSETERHAETWKLREFLARAATEAGNDAYIVSRNGLLARPELLPLWDDLTPLPAMLAPPTPPRGVSLWIGPAGTRSPAHFDPHGVFLVQVQGRKRVRLVAPDHLEMTDDMDGYYASRTHDSAFEVELAAGEALFIPVAWFHEVTALDPSITLSMLCFRWPNQFHWFEPPG